MFGFFFGVACLIGLVAVLKRGGWHGHGCGHGLHGHHHDRGPGRGRGRGGWRRGGWRRGGWMMRGLFERLDTTPGQEKVIQEEVETLRSRFSDLRREWKASGDDLARAMRAESFDETLMGELFARHDDRLREMRKDLVGSLARIHDALDEQQRERVAELLERGRGWKWAGGEGPYRSAH